jgi:glycosyltransferase involved in cell wall biosynthesis
MELVVVDAGGDVGAVVRWLQMRPRLAAVLLAPSQAANVGAARNIGVDFARGRFCLVLDAHQELYPRCLDVLAGTLEAMPEMAFVYPMQEVTGEPAAFAAAGGDHVMSFLGWDPGRLRRGNHIHAPALIRAERLREIGGFATDSRLDGFEDYDLWCRMAERGWSGQLVAQELARRSESGASAVLSAIHPSPGPAVSALTERAPRLLAGAFS